MTSASSLERLRGARITGWGTALPDKTVTNDDLAATLDTSDEWIIERTGIHERRIGGTTCGLATEAGRAALKSAGVDPSEIDLVILATTTPTRRCRPRHLRCSTSSACSAAPSTSTPRARASSTGSSPHTGSSPPAPNKVLVIGAETLSRIVDWDDRGTAILFADGAGAVVLEAVDGRGQLLGWDLDVDGALEPLLYADVGGYIKMDGQEVFRRAVRVMVDSAQKSLTHAGVTADDIALVVPHQANIRIIEAAAATASASRWTGPRPCSTARATRRRRRSRSRSSTRSTRAGCTTATSCCSSASAPG